MDGGSIGRFGATLGNTSLILGPNFVGDTYLKHAVFIEKSRISHKITVVCDVRRI